MPSIIKPLSIVTILFAATQTPAAFADAPLTGCAAKRVDITTQIQQAQDNPQRKAGLEKALDQLNANCRDSTFDKKRNRDVIKAQVAVNETERALHKAERDHKPEDKLIKLREKYRHAKADLAAAEKAVNR